MIIIKQEGQDIMNQSRECIVSGFDKNFMIRVKMKVKLIIYK